MAQAELHALYVTVKRLSAQAALAAETGTAIKTLILRSLKFLHDDCVVQALVSRVANKTYTTFRRGTVVARPANVALFVSDEAEVKRLWALWEQSTITAEEFARLTYTAALAPCLAMEIFDRQNKKGPATFFECYIGHLFSKAMGVNPSFKARLPIDGSHVLLTMDFLFDIGGGHRKVHVPVKMSTRERVVQAWAHQRLLDAAYGPTAYRGVMVLFSETKLDSRSLEVVEICVPDQWLAYQSLLAKMDRIYYFDLPARYAALSTTYPGLFSIKQFGAFFPEREEVLHS